MGETQKQSSTQQIKARWGGLLLVVGAVQFVLAMIIVQLTYPGYSDIENHVSDLGNPNLSPLALLYNASITALRHCRPPRNTSGNLNIAETDYPARGAWIFCHRKYRTHTSRSLP